MKRGSKKRRRLKPDSPLVRGGRGLRYPMVAIVGRPNVGKSTLFNRFVGQRLAIEEPTAGTTRDRLAALVTLEDGRALEVCDTGGLGGTGDPLDRDVNLQIDLAMDYADLILFVVDGRDGLLPEDEKIARRIKKLQKPIVLAANKCESMQLEASAGEFYALGLPGEVHVISAREGTGRGELLAAVVAELDAHGLFEVVPDEVAEEPDPDDALEEGPPPAPLLRLAVLGRRNVGKSTFVNAVLGEERVIASDRPGTTRDAVDIPVEVGGREVVLIDTAGLRKRGRADDQIELISHGRARLALQRADAALLFLDCLLDIKNLDRKLAGMVVEEHKACVIVANKWDLVAERMSAEDFADYCAKKIPHLGYAPVVAISALGGQNASAPIEVALDLFDQSRLKVGTGPLNRALGAAIQRRRPRPRGNQVGKLYFGTQVATNPVTILIFVNDPQLFSRSYRRYLQNQLRAQLPWEEIPIKLVLRARESLYERGGGLKEKVRRMKGLGETARWVGDDPTGNVATLEDELDLEDAQRDLRETFPDDDAEDPYGWDDGTEDWDSEGRGSEGWSSGDDDDYAFEDEG
ncbi:MAG: ribosome biogenesis GTPase Der [Planctomycetota bacterium]